MIAVKKWEETKRVKLSNGLLKLMLISMANPLNDTSYAIK